MNCYIWKSSCIKCPYWFFLLLFLLYNIVLVLPDINMNLPRVYTSSPSWTPVPPPSPYHPSGSSQCTSPKLPASCIESGLEIHFLYDIIHVLMPFSQIIPPPPPTESKRLFYTFVSLLLSCIQGCHYHLSKFHIYALVYCIGVFLSGLLHSVKLFLNALSSFWKINKHCIFISLLDYKVHSTKLVLFIY